MQIIKSLSLGILILSLWNTEAKAVAPTEGDSVIVSPKEIQIRFKVPEQDSWSWYQSGTSANSAEYVWMAGFQLGEDLYRAGFSLFKLPGSSEAQGTLSDLIRTGQTNMWDVTLPPNVQADDPNLMLRGRTRMIQRVKIVGQEMNGYYVVRILDQTWVDRFLESKPEKLHIVKRIPGSGFQMGTIPIHYQ